VVEEGPPAEERGGVVQAVKGRECVQTPVSVPSGARGTSGLGSHLFTKKSCREAVAVGMISANGRAGRMHAAQQREYLVRAIYTAPEGNPSLGSPLDSSPRMIHAMLSQICQWKERWWSRDWWDFHKLLYFVPLIQSLK
jgi:hypothetical protein